MDAGVWRLVGGARWRLAGAVGVGFGQAVLLVAQASVLAWLLAGAMDGGLSTGAVDRGVLLIVLFAGGQAVAGWAWEACAEAAARRVRAEARRRALAAAMDVRAAPEGWPELGPGGLTTLIGSEVDELDPFVGRVLPRAVLALAVPALLLAWIAGLDPVSAGLAGGILLLAPVLAGLVGADTAAAVRRRLASLERMADRFDALVAGLPLLRAFGRAAEHERTVAASGEEVRTATLATLRVALLAGLVLELLATVGTALVAVRLGLRLDAGQRILPRALAVLMLVPEAYLPVRRLTADFHAGAAGRAVLGRLGHLGSTAAVTAAASHVHEGGSDRGKGATGVLVEGVAVVAGGRVVLEGVELRVDAGERVCLTGESGAGKTTLLRVVAGLVAPSAGRVLLEGRAGLGWVPQQPMVLAASVLDNVALGRAGADERTVRRALEAAQLGPWLTRLPLGLRTPLSGLDAPLSLGERRRLAVARCLAGPVPRLWLLDEPTAGLDRAGARRLVAELGRILDGATVIIATHDPEAMTLGQRRVELCQGW
jgi:ABC-type transport system involved in cytochrome bd biosynthesis fused ATPase/permease subunit